MNTLDGALPEPGTFKLDPPHTFVEFKARHEVVGAVRGRFDRTNGTIIVGKDPGDSSVEVTIDSASLDAERGAGRGREGPRPPRRRKIPCDRLPEQGHPEDRRGVGDGRGPHNPRRVEVVAPEFSFNGAVPSRSGEPQRVAFRARAAVQRAAFGMTRELLDEIGNASNAPDVWIEVDAEALQEPAAAPGTER